MSFTVPKERILVVEDSKTAARVLTNIIEDLGYEARVVERAETALELWRSDPFDALVTDLSLPGMSGVELLQEIKKLHKDAIVILVTEHKDIVVSEELKRYEFVFYFRKPANMLEIGPVLKNAFQSRVLRREIDSLRALALSLKSIGNIKAMTDEFKLVLSLAIDSLDADSGALVTKDENTGDYCVRMVLDVSGNLVGNDTGALQQCARYVHERQDSIIYEVTPGVASSLPIRKSVGSVLVAPLIVERKFDGILVLERVPGRRCFNEKELVIAKIFATTVALAIENFKLFQEARRSYEEMLDAQKQLIHLEKLASLGHLTACIAHEIKNPLTVVTGLLGLIRRRVEDDRLIKDVEMSLRNCQRINKIITNLRTLYTPSRSEHKPVDVHEVIEEALSLVMLRSNYLRLTIEKELCEKPLVVNGDESQILQVFINLLNNAINAVNTDKNEGKIRIKTGRDDEYAIISVIDSGPGIAPEYLERIFEPFFTTNGETKGTGLGLPISQTIVRNHGGTITAKSEPGNGAVFTIMLPLEEPSTRSKVERGSKDAERAIRVLVLDDEKDILYWVESLLAEEDIEVFTTVQPDKAIDMLEARGAFDVMLLDGKMPGQDGISLFREVLNKRYPSMKVVLFSGSEDIEETTLLRMGFAGMLDKPCDGEILVGLVRKLTGGE